MQRSRSLGVIVPELDREQRKIVRLIRREGRRIKDPHARRVYERAAVQTGLVESGLRNLPGGDQDSAGWRQERASLYANPTNLRASVRRFREEFQQLYDPGEKSYEVAAQVQRPREDLRGRYHDVAGEAASILRGSPNPGSEVEGGPRYRTVPGVDRSDERTALKRAYFANSHNPDALLDLKTSLDSTQDTPSQRVRISRAGPVTRGPGKRAATGALIQEIQAEADLINRAQVPYQWGGGHQGKQKRGSKVTPLDCSGAVSRVLGIDPRVSGQFEKWGKPGKGAVTVYANAEHVLMEINGHFFGTSKSNPGGGAGWIPRGQVSKEYLRGFTARHL